MCFVGAGAILSAGTSILGSFMGHAAAKKQAWENNAAAAAQEAVQQKYRTELMTYNTQVYSQNISYRKEVMDYQKSEWDRQVDFIDTARDRSEQNYFTKLGGLLTRAFEEQIAGMFEEQEVQAQGRELRAKTSNTIGERNIDGNTADQLMGEVFRQEGEARTMMKLNDTARSRQLRMDVLAVKADHDERIGSLQLQTTAPLAPLEQPSPVAPVQPARFDKGPSTAAMWVNVATGVVNGISGYRSANGLKF